MTDMTADRRQILGCLLASALLIVGCDEAPAEHFADGGSLDALADQRGSDNEAPPRDSEVGDDMQQDAASAADTITSHDAPDDSTAGQVAVSDNVTDSGRSCIEIVTSAATYYYDKEGAGFTSLIDSEGNDWISWKSGGGSAGEYRGIPNLGHCCHPGYSGAVTAIVSQQQAYAKIESTGTADDGTEWRVVWEFYPDHATLTIIDAPSQYYMLYEGTPGGQVDSGDYFVTSQGAATKTMLSSGGDPITDDLPGPEWIYFADEQLKRALLVMHHEDDQIAERYWTMNGEMTVFGFGRTGHGASMGLSAAPQQLSIALIDNITFTAAQQRAAEIM